MDSSDSDSQQRGAQRPDDEAMRPGAPAQDHTAERDHARAPIEVNGLALAAPSSGDGVNCLPAGFLATSRFVRAFWFRRFATPFRSPQEGVQIARHILNQFDIPPGTVMTEAAGGGEGGGVAGAEITQWMTVIDQAGAVMYASTYDHPNLFKVDVRKAAAAADGIAFIPLPPMDGIPELSRAARGRPPRSGCSRTGRRRPSLR